MHVPSSPAMDPLVDDVLAHDGPGELGCIDADQQNMVMFSPGDELVGKQGRVTELDCDFFCPGVLDELLYCSDISEGGR